LCAIARDGAVRETQEYSRRSAHLHQGRRSAMDGENAGARVRRFEEQILPHLPDLYRAARRLVRKPDDAEDLVQDTCLQAFRVLDQLKHAEAAKAWVFTILRSLFLREAGRWDPVRAGDGGADLDGSLKAPPGASPLEGAVIEEARLATQRLPVAFREVVVLAHVAGFSYQEIAAILGVPVGTVMSRLSRGRRLLREALSPIAAGQPRSRSMP
jgi:RNA polymerase sigma-70 factor, ECF subfamily